MNFNHVYLNKNWNTMKFMRKLGKPEKTNGYLMLKMKYYQMLSVTLYIQWAWKI